MNHKTHFRTELTSFDRLSSFFLHKVLKLRQDVFILEQNCLYPDIDGHDSACQHLLITPENDPQVLAGYSRIVPPGLFFKEASIGRIVVDENWRGNQTGRFLVEESMQVTKRLHPESGIRITAQLHLQNFYESLGFKKDSDPYDDAGILHIEMILEE
jgi:ElaA protein